MDTWILVADEHRGRILSWSGDDAPMHEVCDFVNHNPGPTRQPGAHDVSRRRGLPRLAPGPSPASLRFARQLAAALDAARVKQAFAQLVLVAPPGFLGVLRPQLPPQSAHCVVRTVRQHLIDAPVSAIRAALVH
ncbi:MAG: host attachment protein [Lysobacterales bacterium]